MATELIKVTIKGKDFEVPKGARLIDDALAANLQPDWIFCAERLPSRSQETLSRLKKRFRSNLRGAGYPKKAFDKFLRRPDRFD